MAQKIQSILLSVVAGSVLFSAPAHGQTVTAFKTGEEQTGMSKQCYYDALGSAYTRTISAIALCPLTIQVPSAPSFSTAPQRETRSSGGTAFKTGEQVTGMTKQCFYDYLGSQYSKTLSAVALCPLTIRVGN